MNEESGYAYQSNAWAMFQSIGRMQSLIPISISLFQV